MNRHILFLAFFGVIAVAVLVIGFFIVGSPYQQQGRSYDKIRISAFSSIKIKVEDYYMLNRKFPQNLSELKIASYEKENLFQDPQTKTTYDYKVISEKSYDLCTTFSTDSSENEEIYRYGNNNTSHKKGYDCITYTLSDSFLSTYPPVTPTPSYILCTPVNLTNTVLKGDLASYTNTTSLLELETQMGMVKVDFTNAKVYDANCKLSNITKFSLYSDMYIEVSGKNTNNVYNAVQVQNLQSGL